MIAQKHPLERRNKTKKGPQNQRVDFLSEVVKTLTGALIVTALTILFSIVIFAFVIKAFVASEEMAFRLLSSAITPVGTALAAVLGYVLGRNSKEKPEQGS